MMIFGVCFVLYLRFRFFAFVAAKMATRKSSLIKLKFGMHFLVFIVLEIVIEIDWEYLEFSS